jgi:preprotein translocase subunit SecF
MTLGPILDTMTAIGLIAEGVLSEFTMPIMIGIIIGPFNTSSLQSLYSVFFHFICEFNLEEYRNLTCAACYICS